MSFHKSNVIRLLVPGRMILLLFALLAAFVGKAQMSATYPVLANDWLETETTGIYEGRGTNMSEIQTVAAIKEFLLTRYPALNGNKDLKLLAERKSIVGRHYTFRQMYCGLPVYGSSIKINIDPNDRLLSVSARLADTKQWPRFVEKDGFDLIYYDGYSPRLAHWRIEQGPSGRLEFLDLSDGTTLYHDPARYRKGGPKDSLVHVRVFDPDPLTTAKRTYGGSYKNFKDADNDSLSSQLKWRTVTMRYLSDSFWAENSMVKLVNANKKGYHPAYSRTDTFNFNRSDDRFEEMMCIYHISTYQQYIRSLGIDSLGNYPVSVTAHGLEDDNSKFERWNGTNGKGILLFGYSTPNYEHVDDAEDADVIIHEYGHALSYNANENEVNSNTRKSIDEGVGDYLACSYSRKLSEYRWEDLFNWDGYNEFWDGRKCVTTRTMDDFSVQNSIYDNGEIYAGAMMDVWTVLGPEVTDKLVLSSLYFYHEDMRFKDAVNYIMDADSILNKGANKDTLCSILSRYKLLSKERCVSGFNELEKPEILVDFDAFRRFGELSVQLNQMPAGLLRLFDMNGREVFSTQTLENNALNTVISVPSGIYLLYWQSGNQTFTQQLVRE